MSQLHDNALDLFINKQS